MAHHLRYFEPHISHGNASHAQMSTEAADLKRHYASICASHQQSGSSGHHGLLIQHLDHQPSTSMMMKIDNHDNQSIQSISAPSNLATNLLTFFAAPSVFGMHNCVRALVLNHHEFIGLLKRASDVSSTAQQQQHAISLQNAVHAKQHAPVNALYSVTLGLKCLVDVLKDLSKKDPELCESALRALQQLLHGLPPEALSQEPTSLINHYLNVLKTLFHEGCDLVSARAASCLVALAVSHGQPEVLFSVVSLLLCQADDSTQLALPNNYSYYAMRLNRYLYGAARKSGWSHALSGEAAPIVEFAVPCDILTSPQEVIDVATRNDDSECESSPESTGLSPGARRGGGGAVVADGTYVYVLTNTGLYKLGTGFNETVVGYEYAVNTLLKCTPGCWLAICRQALYLRRRQSSRLWVIDTDTLREIGEILLPTQLAKTKLCTDGRVFHSATLKPDWRLQLVELDDNFQPVSPGSDTTSVSPTPPISVKLSTFHQQWLGDDELKSDAPLPAKLLAAFRQMCVGRDVRYVLTAAGTVYYQGTGAAAVGLEPTRDWLPLPVPERVQCLSAGIDSNNLVMLTDAGRCWLIAQADCDFRTLVQPAARATAAKPPPGQQPAAGGLQQVQPWFHRKAIISAAVNGSTLAYVTDHGRVFVAGSHVMHCHPDTGQVLGLDHVHLSTVALGKKHAVAITRHGLLYTWGLNNMYQCGRVDTTGTLRPDEPGTERGVGGTDQVLSLCAPLDHLWVKDVPTTCTACGQCSAHGPKCPSSGAATSALGAGASPRRLPTPATTTAAAASPIRAATSVAHKSCGIGDAGCLRCGVCRACVAVTATTANDASSIGDGTSDRSGSLTSELSDKSRRMVLAPARLPLHGLQGDLKVAKISCGNYHTMLVTQDGQLFTFGFNCHGQLGTGDIKSRIGPQRVQVTEAAATGAVHCTQVAAGANHSVALTSTHHVLTFGSNRKGQLGRVGTGKYWHAAPGCVPGIGGEEAGSIGVSIAAGLDYTLVHCERRIIGHPVFDEAAVSGNARGYLLTAGEQAVWMRHGASTRDARFSLYNLLATGTSGNTSWSLDPQYDVLWCYDADRSWIRALPKARFVADDDASSNVSFLKSPEFWLPDIDDGERMLAQKQVALNMLSVIYCLINSQPDRKEKKPTALTDATPDESLPPTTDYRAIDRFQNYGGGWGYAAHSVEAIQFCVSQPVEVCGFGLFGGRGEYLVRLRLIKAAPSVEAADGNGGGGGDGECLVETDEIVYDCGLRERAHVLLPHTVACQANVWYIAAATINGPSSDCGAGGVAVAHDEKSGVTFHFRGCALSNNGTDVNAGQIAQILFRPVRKQSYDANSPSNASQTSITLSHHETLGTPQTVFCISVSAMKYLLAIADWAIEQTFDVSEPHLSSELKCSDQERYIAVAVMTLRIAKCYIKSLYDTNQPSNQPRAHSEPTDYHPFVAQLDSLIGSVFKRGEHASLGQTSLVLLEEAVATTTELFDILVPCPALLQHRLNLLVTNTNRNNWSLVAVLDALSQQSCIMSLLLTDGDNALVGPHPLLTKYLFKSARLHHIGTVNFASFLRFLLELSFAPSTPQNASIVHSQLRSAATRCLGKITQELAAHIATANYDSQPIVKTTSRFRNVSATPSWEIGQGAADAVAFKVDAAGLSLHGVGVYVGASADSTHFTLEVLLNQNDDIQESWQVLEKVSVDVRLRASSSTNTTFLALNKPLKLYPNNLYALRLSVAADVKTWSGDQGLPSVTALNGTAIHFQPCSLSVNGTNLSRGQLPELYYSVNKAKQKIRKDADEQQLTKWFLLILRLMSIKLLDCVSNNGLLLCSQWLIGCVFGWANVFVSACARSALDVISAVDELLPVLAAHNSHKHNTQLLSMMDGSGSGGGNGCICQTVVESEHPYTPGTISTECVRLDESVCFVCLEFSPACATLCPEDRLTIYIDTPSVGLVKVAAFSGGKAWPAKFLSLPTNCVHFVFESTATARDGNNGGGSPDSAYGFRCVVSGYADNGMPDPVLRLEQEMVWLCAHACALLSQCPSISAPSSTQLSSDEEVHELVRKHGALLRKGFNLTHWPTVREVLNASLPPPVITPELKFLQEFISASSNTMAGRLARWLNNEPFVDLHCCELAVVSEEYVVGRSIQVQLTLMDQYTRAAVCQEMSVEVTVKSGSADMSSQHPTADTLPSLTKLQHETYQPTYLNKARYLAITMMPAYNEYSFEEMRLGYFRDAVLRETLNMSQKRDATMVGRWIPRAPGVYRMECRLDGFQMPQTIELEVRHDTGLSETSTTSTGGGTGNSSQPENNRRRMAQTSKSRMAMVRQTLMSKGLRLRIAPSLTSQSVGLIPRGTVFTYIEELENLDGTWLRLTDEASILHCEMPSFASQTWALQHNKHTNTTFVDRDCDQQDDYGSSSHSIVIQSADTYCPVGQSTVRGIALYENPSLRADVKDFLTNVTEVSTDGWLHNSDGVWLRVAAQRLFCLAQSNTGAVLLERRPSQTGSAQPQQHTEDGRPKAQVLPVQREQSCRPVEAVSPSVADASRSAFAAFLWHEHLVKDATACAAYLKYHPELQSSLSQHGNRYDSSVGSPAPSALQPLMKLWKEINNAVQSVVRQQAIMPSPPMTIRSPTSARPQQPPASNSNAGAVDSEELCELCEQLCAVPVSNHMRQAHPGCGGHAAGYGYNSQGRYTSGWSGCCGDGGRVGATWFLMCPSCRNRYLRQAPSGCIAQRNRRRRQFLLSVGAERPQAVIKQNAMFLLELNATTEHTAQGETSSSGSVWTINLFPSGGGTPTVDTNSSTSCHPLTSETSPAATQLRHTPPQHQRSPMHQPSTSHLSDPGPTNKRRTSTSVHQQGTGFVGALPSTVAAPAPGLMFSSMHQGASRPTGTGTPCTGTMGTGTGTLTTSPSVTLQTLTSQLELARSTVSVVLQQPVIAFLIQHHNLKSIRQCVRSASFRAVLFTQMFRVWNWILRLVSCESSVADIIWHYINAMSAFKHVLLESVQSEVLPAEQRMALLPHPWRLTLLAGPLCAKMVHEFHGFLYTVSVILRSADVSPYLRRLCFRAWTFQLTTHEQDLLMLTCNILSNVADTLANSYTSTANPSSANNLAAADAKAGALAIEHTRHLSLNAHVTLDASTRRVMAQCLFDGDTETFWESGDEDKNRCKTLTMRWPVDAADVKFIFIYVDNRRDPTYRVTTVAVKTIADTPEQPTKSSRSQIGWHSLAGTFVGWLQYTIPPACAALQIELTAADQYVRVRCLQVQGVLKQRAQAQTASTANGAGIKPSPSNQMSFSVVQSDAFVLFQTIASQVFNDEFSQQQSGTLRHQVLDMLFSRVQLQPLQTYVCSQVVNAIEKEVSALKNQTKRNYSYCCGLLVMLTKICQAHCAIEVFSARSALLPTLTELLLFSASVVQCQVIDTIEKVVSHFDPKVTDVKSTVTNLLAVIAKVVNVQVRNRSTHTVHSATLAASVSSAPSVWRVDKACSPDIARLVQRLLTALANSAAHTNGNSWALAIRTELANHIMNLTTLDDQNKGAVCLSTPRFWLALSALCVLTDKHWLHCSPAYKAHLLKSEQQPVQLCENHDDGSTVATVCCEVCQLNLCRDCYQVLHLSRKNRAHHIQIIASSNQRPQIDIHEGCTRLRLPWILILFDSNSQNGMVEFSGVDQLLLAASQAQHDDSHETSASHLPASSSSSSALKHQAAAADFRLTTSGSACRFCGNPTTKPLAQVCEHPECESLLATACTKTHLDCGHPCGGVNGETSCLPCLLCHEGALKQDADDLCVICFTDRIGAAPALLLGCGHLFHFHCIKATLSKRWPGPRITFNFMKCPLCQATIEHASLSEQLAPLRRMYDDVCEKARMRLHYDGLEACAAVVTKGSQFHSRPLDYAIDHYVYVLCHKCDRPYFGGEAQCQQGLASSQYNADELVCGACSNVDGGQICARHGADYLEYKCRYCCSIAVYFCFGSTHFCGVCHDDFQRLVALPKERLPQCPVGPKAVQLDGQTCPLRVQHPPTGEECALGCGICRNISTF